jgi:uncharacterized protein involved in exopolysaccharide biosynthesis
MMAKYVEVLFRYRIRFATLFLIPFALAALITVGFASYRATATLGIADPSSFGATFVPIGWSTTLTPAQNLADGISQVIRTSAFSQGLSDQMTSSGASTSDVHQVVASIGTSLKVSSSGSHLVNLTYTCRRSDLCGPVLSDAVTVLQAQMVQTMRDQAAATATFWGGQLKDAQASLEEAQAALKSYAAANPTATIDSSSSDPQVVLLLDSVRQWKAKVAEAQDNLSLAQYQSTASARLMQIGITVVDPAHLASSRTFGDGGSLLPAGIVLVAGLAAAIAFLVLVVWADKTVRDPRALERRLGVPVVATIPRLVGSRGV